MPPGHAPGWTSTEILAPSVTHATWALTSANPELLNVGDAMKHAKLSLVGALLAIAMVGGSARANIAFEYYEVQRPEIAEAPVGAFLNELSKLGYVANPRDVIDRLGNQAAL